MQVVSAEPSFLSFVTSLPMLTLGAGGVILMLADNLGLLKREGYKCLLTGILLFAAICFLVPFEVVGGIHLNGQISADAFAAYFGLIILFAAMGVVAINYKSLEAQGVQRRKDINVLLLFSTAGCLGLVSSNDLMSGFISLELLSVPVYVLVAGAHSEKASTEGALKYFILGAISSAFLLYGLALTYAATGSLDIAHIGSLLTNGAGLPEGSRILLIAAASLMLFGFAFKLSLAPFHFWTPDAYQGAPLGVNAFMAVVVKAAAFGGLVRIFVQAFPTLLTDFSGFFVVLGAISMVLGNLAALRQSSIKRLFAYSSIAHAGYAVVCLSLGADIGLEALLAYVLFYSLTSLGVFAILVGHLGGTAHQYEKDELSALKGMYARDPIAAVLFGVFVLSFAGIPPLAGFFGKFYLLSALLKAHSSGLAVFIVLNSAISLFYYLRIAALAFEPAEPKPRLEFSRLPTRFVSIASAVLVFSSVLFLDFLSKRAAKGIEDLRSTVSSVGEK